MYRAFAPYKPTCYDCRLVTDTSALEGPEDSHIVGEDADDNIRTLIIACHSHRARRVIPPERLVALRQQKVAQHAANNTQHAPH